MKNTIFAFPCTSDAERCGMTLRDYIAVHAMALQEGVWATFVCDGPDGNAGKNIKVVARKCYSIADAFMEVRDEARETEG